MSLKNFLFFNFFPFAQTGFSFVWVINCLNILKIPLYMFAYKSLRKYNLLNDRENIRA